MSTHHISQLTVGEIARRLEEPIHRIEYVIHTRKIHPCAWAGNLRIFTKADVEQIAGELRRIETAKGGDRD